VAGANAIGFKLLILGFSYKCACDGAGPTKVIMLKKNIFELKFNANVSVVAWQHVCASVCAVEKYVACLWAPQKKTLAPWRRGISIK